MPYVDLTMELSERTPAYPGDPKPEISRLATIAENGWNERRLSFNTHCATHIDAPFHMLPEGKKLEEFPLERFFGRARGVDVSGRNAWGTSPDTTSFFFAPARAKKRSGRIITRTPYSSPMPARKSWSGRG